MKKTVLFIPLFVALATVTVGCSSAEQTTNEQAANEAVAENTNAQEEDTNINDEVVNQESESDTNKSQGGTAQEEIDTSDWLTYTNEEYGFSFEHPKDWVVNEKGTYINVISPKTLHQYGSETILSADLYINNETKKITGDIESLFKESTDYKIISKDSNKKIISIKQFNDFSQSTNIIYYIQTTDKIFSCTFSENHTETEVILRIIDSFIFS